MDSARFFSHLTRFFSHLTRFFSHFAPITAMKSEAWRHQKQEKTRKKRRARRTRARWGLRHAHFRRRSANDTAQNCSGSPSPGTPRRQHDQNLLRAVRASGGSPQPHTAPLAAPVRPSGHFGTPSLLTALTAPLAAPVRAARAVKIATVFMGFVVAGYVSCNTKFVLGKIGVKLAGNRG